MDLIPQREQDQVRRKLRTYHQEEHDLPVFIIWSITLLVPCLVALTNFLMTWLTIGISDLKWAAFESAHGDVVMGAFVLMTFGMLLSGAAAALVYFFAPICAGSGIPEAKGYLNGNHIPDLFSTRAFLVRSVGAVLSVTSGFPIGREGPMVCIGGTVGVGVVHLLALRYVRNWVVLDKQENSALGLFVDEERFELVKRLGCVIGGAAGIACAFNSPIGGIMYMFEEVTVTNWVPEFFFRSFVCTVLASYLTRVLAETLLNGAEYFLIFESDHQGHDNFVWFKQWVDIPFFICVAATCGVMSSAFAKGLACVWSFRARIRHRLQEIHPWAKIMECILYAAIVTMVFVVLPAFWGCEVIPGAHHDIAQSNAGDLHSAAHRMLSATAPAGHEPAENAHAEAGHSGGASHHLLYRQYNCEEGYHNEVATLLLNRGVEGAIKHLYYRHANATAYLAPGALILTFVVYFCGTLGMPGLSVPMGMFMPCMLLGALIGRCFAEIFQREGLALADPGIYAMVGSAAMLGGFTHMTLAIVVLLVEVNHDLSLVPPLMLSIFVAQVVSKIICPHGYDEVLIHKKEVPFLEAEIPRALDHNEIFVKDICETLPKDAHLAPKAPVASLRRALGHEDVVNFPVVYGKACIGIVSRSRLEAALESHDSDKGAPPEASVPVPAAEVEFASVPVKKRLKSLERSFTGLLDLDKYFQDMIVGKDAGPLVEVHRIMDPAPYMMLEDAPVLRMYSLFSKGITSVACVVSPIGHFRGLLSRPNVIEAGHYHAAPHAGHVSVLQGLLPKWAHDKIERMFSHQGAHEASKGVKGHSEDKGGDGGHDKEQESHKKGLVEHKDEKDGEKHEADEEKHQAGAEQHHDDSPSVKREPSAASTEDVLKAETFFSGASSEGSGKEPDRSTSHRLPPKVTWMVTFSVPMAVAFVAFLMTFIEGILVVHAKFGAVQQVISSTGVFGGMITLVAFCATYCGIAATIVPYFAPICMGSGIPEAKGYLNGNSCDELFSLQVLLVRAFCAVLAVSAGFPIGREGPLVCIGGTIGYGIVHVLGSKYVRTSLGKDHSSITSIYIDEERFAYAKRVGFVMGGAAGIAVAFNAPIGGILYLLEEHGVTSWPPQLTFQAFVCTVVAIYSYSLLNSITQHGHVPLLIYFGERQTFDWAAVDIPWFVILALAFGVFSAFFAKILAFVVKGRRKIRQLPSVKKKMPRLMIIECVAYACFVALLFSTVPAFMGCSKIPESAHETEHAHLHQQGHVLGPETGGPGNLGDADEDHVGGGYSAGDHGGGSHGATSPTGYDPAASAPDPAPSPSKPAASAPDPAASAPEPAPSHPATHDTEDHHSGHSRRLSGALEGAHHLSYVQYTCKDGEFNQLATLLLNPAEAAVHHLYLRSGSPFSLGSLAVAGILYTLLAMGMPGLCVPMGLFIPSMMIGALGGRFLGEAFGGMGMEVAHEGVYAMVGSAAMLAGFTHFTISIVVLLVEVSADLSIIVPLMLAIFIANICSRMINEHAFDEVMIHEKHVPFLDPDVPPEIKDKTAAHICRTLPDEALLPPEASMDEVRAALSLKDVDCFPVVDGTSCIGTISKHHLDMAMHSADSTYQALIEKVHSHEVHIKSPMARQQSMRRVKFHGSYHETLEKNGYALKTSYKLGVADRVRAVCRKSRELSGLLPGAAVPVAELMDTGPHILLDTMPVSRFYLMFTKVGVRTIVVVTKRGQFCGTITRADVIAAIYGSHGGHTGDEHSSDENGNNTNGHRRKAKPVTPRTPARSALPSEDKDADEGDGVNLVVDAKAVRQLWENRCKETQAGAEPKGNVESDWSDVNLGSDGHSPGGTPLEKPPVPPPKEQPEQKTQENTARALPVVTNPVTPSEKSSVLYTKPVDPEAHEEHEGQAGRQRFFQQNGDVHHASKDAHEDHAPEESHGEDRMATPVSPLEEVYHAEADDFGDSPEDHGHENKAASDEEVHGDDLENASTQGATGHEHHSEQEGLHPEPEVIGSAHPEHQEEEEPDMVNHWDGFVTTGGQVKSSDAKAPQSHETQPSESHAAASSAESHTDEPSGAKAHDTHGCFARSVAPEVVGSSENGSAERAGTEGYVDVTGTLWSADTDTATQQARAPLNPKPASGSGNPIVSFARGVASCGGMDHFCVERLPRHLANVV